MQVSRGRKPSPPLITAKQIALNAKRLNDTVAKYDGNIIMAQNEIQDAVTQTGLEALAMGLLADTERGEQRGNRALLSAHVGEMGKGSALEKEIGRDALSLGKTVTEASLGLNVLGSFMGTIANVWQANKPDPSKAVDLSKVLSADAKKLMAGPRDQRKIAEAGALEAVSKNLKILEKGTKGLGLSEYESPNLSAGGGVPRARAKAEEVDSDWLHIDKPGDFKWTPESPSIGGDRTLKAPEFPTKDFSNDPVYDPSELISDEAAAKFSGTDFNEYNNMGTLDVRGTGEQGESIDPGINLPRVTGALDEHNLQAEQLDKSLDPVMGALERGEGQRSSRIPDADTLRRGAPRDPLPLPDARAPLGEEPIEADVSLPRMDAGKADLRLDYEDRHRNMVDALTRLNTPFEGGEGQRSSSIPDADALRRGAPRDPLPLPDTRDSLPPGGQGGLDADILRHTGTLDEHNLQAQKLDDALAVVNNAFSRSGPRTAAPMNPELLKWKEQRNQGALDQVIWNLSSGRR